jgi:hypothetical protein
MRTFAPHVLRLARALPWALAAVLLDPTSAVAGGTKTFEVDSFEELDEGEAKGAAIEGSGRVTMGYDSRRQEVAQVRSVFTCVEDGKNVLVGTADGATVQRVELDRRGGLSVTKIADLEGVVVSAMTRLPDGRLLAATLPRGRIFAVDRKGKATRWAELAVEQIWQLVVHDGRVLAATGPKGEVWSLSLDGKDPRVVLDVSDKDVLSLLVVGNDVVAGTSPQAKLYQIDRELEGRLLQDFPGDEVRAMTLTHDGLLVAVNDFEDRGLSSLQNLTQQLARTSLTGTAPTSSDAESSPPKADAALHHVDLGPKLDLARATEAPWEKWLAKDKQYFTDLLAVDRSGTALVSSSASGKIYRVKGRRDVATVGDLEERQATALCGSGDRIVATAADGAAVYRLRTGAPAKATYLTEILDATQPADFGAILVRGDGQLRVRVRSGPGDEPDARWTEWQTVGLAASGDALRGVPKLPRRRYLQVEVSLLDADAELRGLQVFYSPENLAPLLTEVGIKPPKFEIGDEDEPDADATIEWKVDARDDDELVYDVKIRPRGGGAADWIVLTDEGPVTKKELEFDLSTVPDGVYEIAVTASDEPTNGSGNARTDELSSGPFVVDRTRPTIESTRVKGRELTGVALDAGTFVHDVSYAVDAGPFHAASPTDGLFDGPREAFVVRLPELPKGRHRIVVRARDAHGNFSSVAVMTSF